MFKMDMHVVMAGRFAIWLQFFSQEEDNQLANSEDHHVNGRRGYAMG